MRKSLIAGVALILLSVAPAHAQTQSPAKINQQKARAFRQAEIRRKNYAQQQAIGLLFGPQGIPALTRASDPWNYQRPVYYYNQPYRNQYRNRIYYR